MSTEDPAARPRRRRFSAEYKLKIVAEYDACTDVGAKGALLRREGLYSSHTVEWRRAQAAGALAGLEGTPRAKKRTRSRSSSTSSAGATKTSNASWPRTRLL